jgi:AcrR family transcriptional regulator
LFKDFEQREAGLAVKAGHSPLNDRAVEALLALLAEHEWNAVTLPMIAERAGLTLAELRGAFPSKGAILAAFVRKIDQQVLKGDAHAADLRDQPARERLFDVMMRRFDALAPHKAAIRSARRGILSDPFAASAWNRIEINSAQWMLAAAGIDESGPGAGLKAQGLALLFGRVMGTWLGEDDPHHPNTMRELDRQLRQAERLVETGDLLRSTCRPFVSACNRLFSRRRSAESHDETTDPAAAI